jgi:prepilin peptidase CpaA
MLQPVNFVPLSVVLVAGGIAAFTDLRDFKVPNLLTIPLFIAGIIFHWLDPHGSGIAFALQGGLLGFSFVIFFYVLGGMGAGDVKLLAAVGTWLGPMAILLLFVFSALSAGVYAAILSWRHGKLLENVVKAQFIVQQGLTILKHMGSDERIEEAVKRDDRRQRLVPFAAMVLAGVILLAVVKCVGL